MLPARLRGNEQFARSIARFSIPKVQQHTFRRGRQQTFFSIVPSDILQKFPTLRSDRSLWERIIESPLIDFSDEEGRNLFFIKDLVRDHAPNEILSDGELMLQACELEPAVLEDVHPSLVADRPFVASVLKANPEALRSLPIQTQRMFPDLLMATFRAYRQQVVAVVGSSAGLQRKIARDLWRDRAFVLKWFEAGLPYEYEDFRNHWVRDKEIFLLIAANCPSSFRWAHPRLLQDKDFMLQVLERDPSLFNLAHPQLQSDVDLATLFFAGSPEHTKNYVRDVHEDVQIQIYSQSAQNAYPQGTQPAQCVRFDGSLRPVAG